MKTLYEQPVFAEDEVPPTTLKISTPLRVEFVNGPPQGSRKISTYVLYDVLPEELRKKIVSAIQALNAGM